MRKPRTAAGVLLILIFACSVHTWTAVLDATGFVRNAGKRMLSIEITERAHFKATLTESELPATFNFPALGTLRGDDFVTDPRLDSAVFKYRAVRVFMPPIFPARGRLAGKYRADLYDLLKKYDTKPYQYERRSTPLNSGVTKVMSGRSHPDLYSGWLFFFRVIPNPTMPVNKHLG